MSEPDVQGEPPAGVDDVAAPLGPVPAAPAIDLNQSFGLSPSAQRRNWSISLLSALVAHALVLWALAPHASKYGGGSGTMLDGIDVDIVSAASLGQSSATDRPAGTGADTLIYGATGAGATAAVNSVAADQPDQKRAAEPEAAQPQPTLLLEEEVSKEPRPDDIVAAPKKEPEPPKEEPSKPEPVRPETKQPDPASVSSEAAAHEDSGGAAAPGESTPTKTTSAGLGSSSEVVAQYKRSIVEALAARKPQAKAGVRGTVRIAFTIAANGEANTVRVAKSSGRSELDEAALSAVRSIRFPVPPSGLTPEELHYEIPYYFR